MAILTIVLTSLTGLFITGSNAELDMSRRFQAQQDARVGLDKMRREIHCAKGAATSQGTGQSSLVTLRLGSQCPTAVNGVETDVSWCTVPVATSRWALYRKVGASCDATGVQWADYLTQSAAFDFQTQSTTELARLRVEFPIDVEPADAANGYTLCDVIVLRNSTRTAPTNVLLGYDDTAAVAPCS